MRREGELETRLKAWASEYLAANESKRGEIGGECCLAAEVQEAVLALEIQPHGRFAAQALRYEYAPEIQPVSVKMRKLRAQGLDINSAAKYSQLLREARLHVAAWLHIPFAGQLDESFMAVIGSPGCRRPETEDA